mgnify:FL=1
MANLTLQLRFFASIREALGHGEETLQTQARTVAEVRDELLARGGAYAPVSYTHLRAHET